MVLNGIATSEMRVLRRWSKEVGVGVGAEIQKWELRHVLDVGSVFEDWFGGTFLHTSVKGHTRRSL